MNDKQAFCTGFAYGVQYGYEDKTDIIPEPEKMGYWILAGILFDKIKELQHNTPT